MDDEQGGKMFADLFPVTREEVQVALEVKECVEEHVLEYLDIKFESLFIWWILSETAEA
jgi:hypothetical protein